MVIKKIQILNPPRAKLASSSTSTNHFFCLAPFSSNFPTSYFPSSQQIKEMTFPSSTPLIKAWAKLVSPSTSTNPFFCHVTLLIKRYFPLSLLATNKRNDVSFLNTSHQGKMDQWFSEWTNNSMSWMPLLMLNNANFINAYSSFTFQSAAFSLAHLSLIS